MANQTDLPDSTSGRWQPIQTTTRRLAEIDPRSLALLRIAIGLILLFDLTWRLPDIPAFYADGGILSIDAVRNFAGNELTWSLHFLSGSPVFQMALFAVAAIFALCLLVGFQTRLATIASWVLLVSLHARAPILCNGGDILLRMLLFWGMFLPLGGCWSVDSRHRGTMVAPVSSVATAAIMLQLCFMYFFTGILKFNGDWLSGIAVGEAMATDWYRRPLGQVLAQYPTLLFWLTHGTLWLELVVPVLVWSPWFTRPIRLASLAAYLMLHLGIESCISTGLFSWISIAAWSVFLPSAFWDRLPRLRFAASATVRPYVPRRVAQAVSLAALLYVAAYNVATVAPVDDWNLTGFAIPGRLLLVEQRWNMFERPTRYDIWYVARARLNDGRLVDLLRNGEPPQEEEPDDLLHLFPNQHWRYFFQRLAYPLNARLRPPVAAYLMRQWNERHAVDEQVARLELVLYREVLNEVDGDVELHSEIFAALPEHAPEVLNNFESLIMALQRDGNVTIP